MRKFIILFIFLIVSLLTNAQKDTLKLKLDSILKESDILYRYEKVAWVSTDLVMENNKLKKQFGGYIIYHSNDTTFATIIDKDQKGMIAKYYFINSDLNKPFKKEIEDLSLSKAEQELLNIKMTILNQLSNEKYDVRIPEGYNPNFDLIKEKNGFKLYVIMGTSKSGIIPFGNDYLFKTDIEGNITSWKKFHSRIIPAQNKAPNGEKVISSAHTHLKTTPYISATDICTFRLYAKYCDMKEFMVVCIATGKNYKYNLESNSIVIEEK